MQGGQLDLSAATTSERVMPDPGLLGNEILLARAPETTRIPSGNLIDLSEPDMEVLVTHNLLAVHEITHRGTGMVSRDNSMTVQGDAEPRVQGPLSVRTRSGKLTDIGR